jgi:hypothetical protein
MCSSFGALDEQIDLLMPRTPLSFAPTHPALAAAESEARRDGP